MTDHEIIEHLKENRYSAALKGLYNVFPDAKKYIKANSGNTDDAKDVFQDALVVLCNKVRSADFVLTVPLKNYLLAVVKNCWLQELRQRKKLPEGVSAQDPAAAVAEEGPEYPVAAAAFKLLGEKCKQLLILFYFNKQSFKHIAAALAFSDEKTAKNQKYRCLQKAKENYVTLLKNGAHE